MTKTPQTEAENTPKRHIFGSHFRYWREKRGYSLKEAAGNTMSVASLSRFETDKQSITIERLAELLMNIGVDFGDFIQTYGGQRIHKVFTLPHNKQYDDALPYYQDYPEWLALVENIIQSIKNEQLLSQQSFTPLSTNKIEQILLRRKMNQLESMVIYYSLKAGRFPTSLIPQLVVHLKEVLIESTSKENGWSPNNMYNFFTVCTVTLHFLSRQGYHQEVFSFIDYTIKRFSQLPRPVMQLFTINLLEIQVFEVYSLIRSGDKTKAFKRRQEITKALDALIAAHFKPSEITEHLVHIRTALDVSCTQLLSGQLK